MLNYVYARYIARTRTQCLLAHSKPTHISRPQTLSLSHRRHPPAPAPAMADSVHPMAAVADLSDPATAVLDLPNPAAATLCRPPLSSPLSPSFLISDLGFWRSLLFLLQLRLGIEWSARKR